MLTSRQCPSPSWRRGSPSWLAFFYLAEIGPLCARFPPLERLYLHVWNLQAGQDARFRREAARILPQKLLRGRTPSRSAPWTVPSATKLGHNDAPSSMPRDKFVWQFSAASRPKIASGPDSTFETCRSSPKSENRARSGPIFAKILSRGMDAEPPRARRAPPSTDSSAQ